MCSDWTPEIAEEVADRDGIALGEKHWAVIAAWRELAARKENNPSLKEVGAACGMSVAHINKLFPDGSGEIMRLAGAPEFEKEES